jgi:mRNA-degrading endonuclease HigB of HigAB toxin-antitoxin module
VKGNRYRLEAVVAFNTKVVVARWIGTHAEHTRRSGHQP